MGQPYSETIVLSALVQLFTDKLIKDYYQHPQHSFEDRVGIDFTVTRLDGELVPIQAKGDRKGFERHYVLYRDIPAILIKSSTSVSRAKSELLAIINGHNKPYPDLKTLAHIKKPEIHYVTRTDKKPPPIRQGLQRSELSCNERPKSESEVINANTV